MSVASSIRDELSDARSGAREILWTLGRVLLGGMFVITSVEKFSDMGNFAAVLVRGGFPADVAAWLAPFAASVEMVGALCIVFGVATGWACWLMIAFTLAASFTSHRFWEFEGAVAKNHQEHFLKNWMLCGAFLMLYVNGAGRFSLDRIRRK
jgi:putative oxidoreductase